MKRVIAFLAILAGGFALACLGIGLVISAFAGKRITKAGQIRAVIGGVLIAAVLLACLMFLN